MSDSVKFMKRNLRTVSWESNPGAQTEMLLSVADETLVWGERGSGMTQGLLAWMVTGNPSMCDLHDPARHAYLNDRSYRGLLLVSPYESIKYIYDEALAVWGCFGAKLSTENGSVRFPSGAEIVIRNEGVRLLYLKDGFTRIGIDQLARFPKERRYVRLMAKLRNVRRRQDGSLNTSLPCGILSTTQCVGPGAEWIYERFIAQQKISGILPVQGEMFSDSITGLTRMHIRMGISENPYLRDNQQYRGMMLAQDEMTRRAWMDADWSVSLPD